MLDDKQIQLGRKALKKSISVEVSTSLKELLGLLLKLNFSSQLIPNYRKKGASLLVLVGKDSDRVWREIHTECLNDLPKQVYKRIKIGFIDTK